MPENTSGSSECGSTQHTMSTLDETRGGLNIFMTMSNYFLTMFISQTIARRVTAAAVSSSITTPAISVDQPPSMQQITHFKEPIMQAITVKQQL